ncbi:hypothetical protein QAD02_002442 [Eretmocerus hayati]|uniref:Uncharacterized protein n=1 Tax=Eretmocerus hayati TaxID=131215 RepID=A0ACC2NJ19_9HYME|nr:hypothetical protein QAD02_002442 [Eretmocerus hayati]
MVLLNISSSVHGDLDTNENIRLNKSTSLFSYVKPGVYKDIELLVAEINELDSISKHLKFKVARGGYVTVERICTDDTCSALKHTLQLSKRLRNILGFDPYVHDIHVNLKEPTVGKFPGSLANGLPNMLMIYADICEPYYTGSSRSKLLRVVPLDTHNYAYGGVKIKNFAPPISDPGNTSTSKKKKVKRAAASKKDQRKKKRAGKKRESKKKIKKSTRRDIFD